MKIRMLSIILSLSMLLSAVCACTERASENDNNGDVADQTSKYEGMLVIDEEYAVVRGENCDSITTKAALLIKNALCEATGKEINIKTDYVKNGDEAPKKEIVVGKNSRDLALNSKIYAEGEYHIGIEDERIVIDAYDTELLYFAVQMIADTWLQSGVGIQNDGAVIMNPKICARLNGQPTALDSTITVISQNLRYNDDGNGNDISDRAPRFEQLVEQFKPDIMGLQESTTKWNQQLKSRFSDEYGMVGCSRDGKTLQAVSGTTYFISLTASSCLRGTPSGSPIDPKSPADFRPLLATEFVTGRS